MAVTASRQRWVDICLSREEALIADNSLSIQVGASADTQRHITVIDACVCYVKTKECLGWNKAEAQLLQRRFQDSSQPARRPEPAVVKQKAVKEAIGQQKPQQIDLLAQHRPHAFDCLLGQSLAILEDCALLLDEGGQVPCSVSVDLLSLLCPPLITFKAKSLLYTVLALSSKSGDPGGEIMRI